MLGLQQLVGPLYMPTAPAHCVWSSAHARFGFACSAMSVKPSNAWSGALLNSVLRFAAGMHWLRRGGRSIGRSQLRRRRAGPDQRGAPEVLRLRLARQVRPAARRTVVRVVANDCGLVDNWRWLAAALVVLAAASRVVVRAGARAGDVRALRCEDAARAVLACSLVAEAVPTLPIRGVG